jgi:hypothetical protein
MNGEERRAHERVAQKGYISVTVESAPDAPNLEGKVFRCTTRDLSAGGLLMVVHSRVPIGTTVRVHVVFTDPEAEFEHIGRVAWVKSVHEDFLESHSIGIEILRSDGNTTLDWAEMVAARMQGSKGPTHPA